MMPHLIDETEALLRERGFKVTPQRTLLLQVMASRPVYMSAEEIYELAHDQDESISLATVYRTLNLFAELGLVDHRYVEPEHRHEVFRLSEGPEQHYLTCVRCGRRVLIHADLLNQMASELVRRKGVSVIGACACFTGYCADCTAELDESTRDASQISGHSQSR
ncbi:MAG TPA: Fur family transcriptional regulator [Aggregatilineaceae bacterium]|nr:Fur family transcriptional regulator [Aggregatilineaceae bacterium]